MDLPASSSTSSVFLFGDDTKCLKPACSISDCLSMKIDLLNLTTWSQHWNLNFNAAKCALLRFSSGCPPTAFNYILNGDLISAQETHRDLGIIMSSYLMERAHEKYSIQSIQNSQQVVCSGGMGEIVGETIAFQPSLWSWTPKTLYYLALVTVLKPKRFIIFP